MRAWLLAMLVLVLGVALGGEVSEAPVLRLELGMHTAPINRIGVDRAGRILVTASDDKTARVWDLKTGALLRVLRPPIGEGSEGKLYAAAISPDGGTVAVGGRTEAGSESWHTIYLFEVASGRMVGRIQGLPNVNIDLAFSSDGARLGVALGSGGGMRVYAMPGGQELGRDAWEAPTYGLDFGPDGGLVLSSFDGQIRRYGSDLKRVAQVKAPGGVQPVGVDLSPDGTLLAVGYNDSTRVDVLDSRDLRLLYSADTQGVDNGSLSSVTWSADGQTLYAAGMYDTGAPNPVLSWTQKGRGPRTVHLVGAGSTVEDLAPLPGGGLAFGAADPLWGLLGADRSAGPPHTAALADLRDGTLALDATAERVRFGYQYGGVEPAVFSVVERRLQRDASDALLPPRTEGLPVTGWKNSEHPQLGGVALPIKDYEMSRALAIAADASSFVLGTEWYLRAFDSAGKPRWSVPVPAPAWSVNLSADGRLLVAGLADGTIRWYRADNGRELLALFPHADQRRWVLWTPGGYYDASPGAEELLGWHVNRGPATAADFFPLSRYRDQFYRPDVVSLVLQTLDEAAALARADAAAGRKVSTVNLAQLQPPVLTLRSPTTSEVAQRGPTLTVQVQARAPAGVPVTRIWAQVDGRAVQGAKDLAHRSEAQGDLFTLELPVPQRDCTVQILAETALSTSEPLVLKLRWDGAQLDPAFDVQPTLYLLSVGVSRYQNPAYNLQYAAKDATEVAAAMSRQAGRLYKNVETRVLTDQQATKGALLDGLEWLQRSTTQHDVAMVFFSGHGLTDPSTGQYYFVPHDADLDAMKRTLVSDFDVRTTLSNIQGKVVFFLDSCHAGQLLPGTPKALEKDVNRFINELSSAESGVIVLSASTGSQQSLELPELQNGVFTEALLEGLAGKADYEKTGRITVTMLDLYLSERVKSLTKGLQTPTTAKPQNVPDFPLVLTR